MVEQKKISSETITRRTWIEWAGKATVLALGADLLSACSTTSGQADKEAGAGPGDPDQRAPVGGDSGGTSGDISGGGGGASDGGGSGRFDFQPGSASHDVYNSWGERTVDAQDIKQILASWKLTIDGLVAKPVTLSFADLVALPRQDQVTDFHCVEGWSVLDVPWNGVRLADLLDAAKPTAKATHVTLHTIGSKYNESLPLSVVNEPRTLAAYGVAGSTLPLKHGFPLRIVIPRLLAYKNAKYVDRLELSDTPVHGYWVKAGYPYAGEVPASRLREGKY